MFCEFLLLFGQRTCLALITECHQFFLSAVLIFVKPEINGLFVNKECLSGIGNRPTAAEKNDCIHSIHKTFVAKGAMQCSDGGNLLSG